jgi:phosphoribosylaminoimidazolecarboxamide formyltransferase/IMP cyclohydrolase
MANSAAGARDPLALVSVSDKTGIIEFCRALVDRGFRLLSTGGTARALTAAGLPVTEVSEHTGSPQIMGGRVKTLHPRIHGGLLGRRGEDEAVMTQQGIQRIDLAVINLYPFETVTRNPDCTFEEAIENIDIGGPAMVRSAAKNFDAVAVVTSPEQYAMVVERLDADGGRLDRATRYELAVAAFDRVAQYDDTISEYLSARGPDGEPAPFPGQANLSYSKRADLRYGENPHQQAAWYQETDPPTGSLATARQHQGKELSYNNIADSDAAWECIRQFETPACAIIKHANPCGVATAATAGEAYELALATDPTSAFGGIIAFNRPLDATTAAAIVDRQFLEVLIAPAYEEAALSALAAKQNVRVLEIAAAGPVPQRELKRVSGGLLIQTSDLHPIGPADCRAVTEREPTGQEWDDLIRYRRRPDEPGGFSPYRTLEGRGRRPSAGRRGPGVRRVLPLPRRHRHGGGGRHFRGDPAGRFDARRRGDRGRQRARHRHGIHRHPSFQALKDIATTAGRVRAGTT